MTRLFTASDSHGAREMLEAAAHIIEEGDFAEILHLGDCVPDAAWLEKRLNRRVTRVAGNCDYFSREAREITLRVDGVKMLLTHGDRQGVKSGRAALSYRAEEVGATLAIYGHTHRALIENMGGILCVNPCALRDGRAAIIEIDAGKARVTLTKVK